MDKKLIFYTCIFYLMVSIAYSQSTAPVTTIPANIVVNVVDNASVSADSEGNIPIIDLLNDIQGVSLIYPSESVAPAILKHHLFEIGGKDLLSRYFPAGKGIVLYLGGESGVSQERP